LEQQSVFNTNSRLVLETLAKRRGFVKVLLDTFEGIALDETSRVAG